jgi:hypothetical protein
LKQLCFRASLKKLLNKICAATFQAADQAQKVSQDWHNLFYPFSGAFGNTVSFIAKHFLKT